MTQHPAASSFTRFETRPLSPLIGAEIHGIDLAQDLDDAMIADLRQALLTYKVIFFRDQNISRAQHIAFARRFGPLEIHPATPADQVDPEVLRITHGPDSRGRENAWHSDVTWRPEPSLGSILRAIELPPAGTGTEYIRGIGKENNRLIILLDVDKLFGEEELQELKKAG